jgi:RimJ/RimL family protein N-acetyltransferase
MKMILGKTIRLRAVEREDLKLLVAWLNDPEVRENLSMYNPISMGHEELWYETTLKRPSDEQPLAIEVLEKENWVIIGDISLMHLNWKVREAEVGLFIGEKSYWNRGFGRKAIRLILRHAFQTMNLNRVFLRVNETNLRGIRSYEKTGFVHEGRLRQAAFLNGHYIDLLLMGILRSEWQDEEN